MENFFQNLFLVLGAFSTTAAVFSTQNEGNAKRFIVVSEKEIAENLYPLSQRLKSDQDRDTATKKQICDDIVSTEAFLYYDYYPYKKRSVSLVQKLLLNRRKNYTSRFISSVEVGQRTIQVDETAFVCLVRIDFGRWNYLNVYEYYVSSEYRLYTRSNDPNAGYIGVRFVFECESAKEYDRTYDIIRLRNVAETPADVYQFSPHFRHIENFYMDRRENFMPTYNRRTDSLCQLELQEKRRICLAVFNSSYFDGKVEYPVSHINVIDGKCERKTVSFQTDSTKQLAKAKKRRYEEWMMNCKPNKHSSYKMTTSLDYLLSSAYVDNEILVYYQHPDTEQTFVEILATNVRISIDNKSIRKREPGKTDDDYEYDLNEKIRDYMKY